MAALTRLSALIGALGLLVLVLSPICDAQGVAPVDVAYKAYQTALAKARAFAARNRAALNEVQRLSASLDARQITDFLSRNIADSKAALDEIARNKNVDMAKSQAVMASLAQTLSEMEQYSAKATRAADSATAASMKYKQDAEKALRKLERYSTFGSVESGKQRGRKMAELLSQLAANTATHEVLDALEKTGDADVVYEMRDRLRKKYDTMQASRAKYIAASKARFSNLVASVALKARLLSEKAKRLVARARAGKLSKRGLKRGLKKGKRALKKLYKKLKKMAKKGWKKGKKGARKMKKWLKKKFKSLKNKLKNSFRFRETRHQTQVSEEELDRRAIVAGIEQELDRE